MRYQWIGLIAAALLLAGCDFTKEEDKGAPTAQAPVAATQIDGDYLTTGGDGSNWAAIGFNYYEQRFSPLDDINRSNVGDLGVAWAADLPGGEVPQSTPIVADGKIYIATPRSRVFAFDAASGEQLWTFNPGLAQPEAGQTARGPGNQGLAIWKGRLFLTTLDGQLIALDAITGAQLWSSQTGADAGDFRITSTPRVVKNMVIIGSGRPANSSSGARGYVSAYDVSDGALRWRFYTVPKADGTPDNTSSDAVLGTARQTWGGSALGAAAGGYVTDAVTYDPDLDQLYIGVGAGSSLGEAVSGDRLFLSSIVALDPDNGEYLWHYQETPGSRPGFGADQPFILADLPMPTQTPDNEVAAAAQPAPKAGPTGAPTAPAPPAMRKVLLHASDNGFFFVIDRRSGKLVSATALFDQPAWTGGYDPATGRPERAGLETSDSPSSQIARGLKSVPAPRPAFPPVRASRPVRWMSFSPQTGLVYFELPNYVAEERDDPDVDTSDGIAIPAIPSYRIEGARIIAFDPVAGEIRWSRDLIASRNGAPLTTAGRLLFLGTGIGRFVALDAETGATLYNRDLGSGMAGAPSTFRVGGVQYVAVLTGLGGVFETGGPRIGGQSADTAEQDAAAMLLRVPARPRLVLMRLGANGRLDGTPAPVPSPTPMPSSTSAATPASEPRRP